MLLTILADEVVGKVDAELGRIANRIPSQSQPIAGMVFAIIVVSEVIEKRAGRLRAVDRTADQLLKTAIRWAAHLDDELYPERAAVPIVLGSGLGVPVNVCWVIGESGLVLVSINDRPMTEERLTTASLVYGITPAQLRLAKLIVGGHDIVTAAKLLKVSVNTARTHLQRMYDRTGVRSQPALVRAMLSVARPLG